MSAMSDIVQRCGEWVYKEFVYKTVYAGGKDLRRPLRRLAFAMLSYQMRSVKLHLTASCNLSCKNCYARKQSGTLSKEEIVSFLEQLKPGVVRNRRIRLDLLGGEPLLHPDLEDIVRYAKTKVRIRTVELFTNGTLLTTEMAGRLKEAGLDVAIVTLHSHLPDVHDRITQFPGSWQKTVDGLGAALRAGLAAYSFTILAQYNYDHLKEVEEFVRRRGARTIYFPYIKQRENDELCLENAARFREAIRWMVEKSPKHKQKIMHMLRVRGKVCPAFVNTLAVQADGTVTPCAFVDLRLGSIKEEKLDVILKKAYVNRELADFLAIPSECAHCSVSAYCGGGCKAFRYSLHRDTRSRDINCLGAFTKDLDVQDAGSYLTYTV